MSAFNTPRLRLFVGAALISLSPVWVRLVSVPPTTSGFYRVLIGGAALVIYLAIRRQRLELSPRAVKMLVAASIFFTLDLWFWHRSINYIGPGLSTLITNFQVFFMMLAGVVILREMPRPVQIVAVPLALFGLGMIVGFDWGSLPGDYKLGVILALLTAVSYAGFMLSLRASRQDSKHVVPTREVAAISLGCTLLLGITAMAEGESLAIASYSDLGWLAAYGVLSHCIGWLFIASSLPLVSPTEAGIALLLQPMLSFIWDILLFDRPTTGIELVGAAIALFAIWLGSRNPSQKP